MAQAAGGAQWTEPEKSVRVAKLDRAYPVEVEAGVFEFSTTPSAAALVKQVDGELEVEAAPVSTATKARLARQGNEILIYGV